MRKPKQPKSSVHWSHKHDYPIEEVWNTKNTLARLISPRLVTFRDLDKHGCPNDFENMRQWTSDSYSTFYILHYFVPLPPCFNVERNLKLLIPNPCSLFPDH